MASGLHKCLLTLVNLTVCTMHFNTSFLRRGPCVSPDSQRVPCHKKMVKNRWSSVYIREVGEGRPSVSVAEKVVWWPCMPRDTCLTSEK
jgi:hypothetical protein